MYTPQLLLDKKIIFSNLEMYKRYGQVYYPIKANADSKLLSYLKTQDISFNVSSLFYLKKLLDCGINSRRILWDNCFSNKDELDFVFSSGVVQYAVDDIDTYMYIHQAEKNAKFFIKLSIDSVDKSKPHKYGIYDMKLLMQQIKKDECIEGISFYLDNDNFEFLKFEHMVKKALSYERIKILNIGGCLKNFFSDIRFIELLEEVRKYGKFDMLAFEPGRSLLNSAAKIHTKIVSSRTHNGRKWLRIDMSIYSGLIDIYIENKLIKFNSYDGDLENYIVTGFTSDSEDYFGEHLLPKNLKIGDILMINDCGAYTVDMCSKYSGAKNLKVRLI